MRGTLALFALALTLASLAPACAPLVGDACEDSTDCGRSMFCERSLPDGYCTIKDCEDRACPDDGVCIRFDESTSWCMQPCENDGDCRDDYVCVTDFGVHPFCNDARGTPRSTEP